MSTLEKPRPSGRGDVTPEQIEHRALRLHVTELENMLAGPIAEQGLRHRIREEYIRIKELETTDGYRA